MVKLYKLFGIIDRLREAACGFLCANSLHAAFSLFVLVVQGMLYSNHGDAREQKSTTPQAALKAACGCGATCLLTANPPSANLTDLK